ASYLSPRIGRCGGLLLGGIMQLEKMYVVGGLGIAICIWVEAIMLEKNAGRFLQDSVLFAVISLLTLIWLLVSAAALYFLQFDRYAISVPVVYGIYSVMGWVYGAKLVDKLPDDPRELVMPAKYLVFSKSFALVFAALCVFVLLKHDA
ncbi:MAG: hypothetical protein Q4A69_06215, partial [Moraxella sp.]|nr:hypothetical protein [Moraxella sp.]